MIAQGIRAADRLRIPLLVLSFGLLLLVAGAKASAAKPPLGAPLLVELPYHPSPRTVTLLLVLAYVIGAAALGIGLTRPRIGSRWTGWVLALAALALLTAPIGSGDHTNYAAYGRIAIQGGDPYSASPEAWHGGLDPITSSVQPPWRDTPSIYGPLGTALMAVSSAIGGDDLRRTVFVWQVIIVLAWLGMRAVLLRLAQSERSRGRVDVLWTFNPIVFGPLVLGAHVDLIAGLFAVAALWTLRRSALLTGLLVGAAASTKITYGVVALGIIWAWRGAVLRHPAWRSHGGRPGWRRLTAPLLHTHDGREQLRWFAVGLALVIVPCYLVAGPHVFRQLGAAGGSFSYATPAALLWQGLRHVLPEWAVATVVFTVCAAAMIALAWLMHRVIGRASMGRRVTDGVIRQAVVTTWALSTAYVLCAPYTLPWYDVLTWALLPLLLEMRWDKVLVLRGVAMILAYLPGRVLGLSPAVESATLGFRTHVAPWLTLACLLLFVGVCVQRLRRPRSPAARSAG